MVKFLVFIFFSLLAFGRFDAVALKECKAFNNLKHTKNSEDVSLKKGKHYLVYKEHKGQYLIRVEGKNPSQRWVDIECLKPTTSSNTNSAKEASKKTQLVSVLVLSWQNSFCQTHQNRKECRILNRSKAPSHLVLHGLWPQPRNNQYCGVDKKLIAKDKHHQWRALPKLNLSKETMKLMEIYMPGYISGLDRHEWIKHGTCYSNNPEEYFHDALSLTKEVDQSLVGEYLRANEGSKIDLVNLKRVFDKAFGKGSSIHLEMRCKNRLLSELWIHIKGKGDKLKELLKGAPKGRSKCKSAIVDAKGY
jgi:ribonuclease T2